MDDKDLKKFQWMQLASSIISFICVLALYLRRKAGLIGGINRIFLLVLLAAVVLYVFAANQAKPVEDERREAFQKKMLEEEKARKEAARDKKQ